MLRWSPAAQRLFGWKAEEVLGKRFSDWEFVVPDDMEVVNQVGNDRTRGRNIMAFRAIAITRSSARYCIVSGTTPRSTTKHGKLVSVLSLVLDVTVATRIEEALRKSEAQYRLLFESNPQPMWVYDLTTLRFLAVNDAAVRHYGYSRAEFLDMTIKDIRPPEDVKLLEDYLTADNSGTRSRRRMATPEERRHGHQRRDHF